MRPSPMAASRVLPYVIRRGERSPSGKVVYARAATSFGPVIQPQTLSMMNAMLHRGDRHGRHGAQGRTSPAGRSAASPAPRRIIRDAWFVGYTGEARHRRLARQRRQLDDEARHRQRPARRDLGQAIMKAAHAGQQPVQLPGGLWQVVAEARSSTAASRSPASRAPARTQQTASSDRAWTPPAPQEKNFFERLFGG
jgi:penicillin-binding protein 1A